MNTKVTTEAITKFLGKCIEDCSIAELVYVHNELVPPPKGIKKFATKSAAIKRVQALLEESLAKDPSPEEQPEAKPRKGKGKSAPVSQAETSDDAATPPDDDKKAPRASTVYVETNGTFAGEFRSVAAAFKALDLPMGKHQLFRKKLKASGREVIDAHTFSTTKL